MDLKNWKIFCGLDSSLTSNCKLAKIVRIQKVGFLVLQNEDVYAVADQRSNAATGSEVTKIDALCGKGIIDFYGYDLGFVALSKSGCVYLWNKQEDGDHERDRNIIPKQVRFPGDVSDQKVCQVSCGFNHCLCLTSDGEVFGWGNNLKGQLGSGGPGLEYRRDAVKITGLGENMVQVAAGALSSFALDSAGRVWSWGVKLENIQNNRSKFTRTPRIIENLPDMRKIVAGGHHLLALSVVGEIYFWGNFGPTNPIVPAQTRIKIYTTEDVTDIESFSDSAVVQTKDTVYLWGYWHGTLLSSPMATEFTSIAQAFASADLPTMLKPIVLNVQPHRIADVWKNAYDDQSTSDIVFSVDNENLHAHAAFLTHRSEYFRKMFNSDWKESKGGASLSPIKIQGFSFRVFKAFVYFLYHDSLMDSDTVTVEDLAELIRAADYYGNDDLRLAGENKLKGLLTPENASFVYACAMQSNAKNLMDYAAEYVGPVFNQVVKSLEFAKMDNDSKTNLMIQLADLNVLQASKKRRLQ